MMKLSAAKVTSCYDLMDSAYDAAYIRAQSQELGHVAIIDRNPRGQQVVPMAPHEAVRYRERSDVERSFGRLKDEFGARNVHVRGPDKVMLHTMFGVITLFADQLLKVTSC
jgi:hypothetical protein